MTTNSHSRPSAAWALTTATASGSGRWSRGVAGSPSRLDVADHSAQRRAGCSRHVLFGHIEQRGHRVEVAVGLRAGEAAALAGRQPAPLQARSVPGLPQCVSRVSPVVGAAARRREHRAHPPQRAAEIGRQVIGFTVERLDEQITEVPRRPAAIGTAQRPSQLAQRHRIDPADGPGQQRTAPDRRRDPSAVASSTVSSARDAACSASGTPDGGVAPVHPPRSALGPAPRPARHRADDDRHLRPRHPVDEMGSAQRVGDQRGFGVR